MNVAYDPVNGQKIRTFLKLEASNWEKIRTFYERFEPENGLKIRTVRLRKK